MAEHGAGGQRTEPGAGFPRPGGGELSQPPATAAPGPVNSDQQRQFEQFQRFQEFLRFQQQQGGGATPTPAGPPQTRLPRWIRRLGAKIFSILVIIIVLIIGGKLALDYFLGSGNDRPPASETGGGTYHTNKIFPDNPYGSIQKFYQNIAESAGPTACTRLIGEAAQQQFATNMGYSDCPRAVIALHGMVTDVSDYAEPIPFNAWNKPLPSKTIQISSCGLEVKSGPSLGTFILTEVEFGQWIIIGHAKDPSPCPTSPQAAPSNPSLSSPTPAG